MKVSRLLLTIGALLPFGAAIAQVGGILDVSATIGNSCVFAVGNATLPFGTLTVTDLANGKNETTQATVNITCTNSATQARLYGAATRQMTYATSNVITYEVYTDSARVLALGTTQPTGVIVLANGVQQAITLWGKTIANQGTKPTGAYTQALALTVQF